MSPHVHPMQGLRWVLWLRKCVSSSGNTQQVVWSINFLASRGGPGITWGYNVGPSNWLLLSRLGQSLRICMLNKNLKQLLPTHQGENPWSGLCGHWLPGPESSSPRLLGCPRFPDSWLRAVSLVKSKGFPAPRFSPVPSRLEVWRHSMGNILLVSLSLIFNFESHSTLCFSLLV